MHIEQIVQHDCFLRGGIQFNGLIDRFSLLLNYSDN